MQTFAFFKCFSTFFNIFLENFNKFPQISIFFQLFQPFSKRIFAQKLHNFAELQRSSSAQVEKRAKLAGSCAACCATCKTRPKCFASFAAADSLRETVPYFKGAQRTLVARERAGKRRKEKEMVAAECV